jgi:hypothetical protein
VSTLPRHARVAHLAHRRRLAALPLVLLVAGLAIALTGVAALRPAPALALSTLAARCDGVALRARPSTSATKLTTLSKGMKVVAVDKVSGGSWRTACAGTTATGSSWYKITVANGKDVRTRFGVSYVYGASSLFKKLYSMSYKKTACDGVSLRTRASTDATRKATLSAGTKVTVIGTVSGGSWRASCAGNAVSGSSWYKINQINGKSTSSLYGVGAVYAAKGLFTSVSSPAPTTSGVKSVRVSSIRALLTTLADNTVGEIVVANGRYHVSPASQKAADSLSIDARYAGRTRAVTVRAETRGGVTFDGGGATSYSCISFVAGAHHQTWDGFRCANGQATSTGIVTVGGYAGLAAPHHITLRNITITGSCTGRAKTASDGAWDHAFYLSYAVGGPHDLLFEDITVDGRGGLASAFHFFHSDSTNKNAWNVTVRRLHVTGTQQAIILWDPTLRNITFDRADITDALSFAVRHEAAGASGIVYANITSTGSGSRGFYSSMGTKPSGVTFTNNSFH